MLFLPLTAYRFLATPRLLLEHHGIVVLHRFSGLALASSPESRGCEASRPGAEAPTPNANAGLDARRLSLMVLDAPVTNPSDRGLEEAKTAARSSS
jgi:hypothetical protein